MTDTVLTRVAALKVLPFSALKEQWRDLFETEPPPYNRQFLEHRLAYRIQELAYGGLKPETLKRLRALGEQSLEGRTFEGASRYPAIVVPVRYQDPTLTPLAGDKVLAGLALRMQRVELLL